MSEGLRNAAGRTRNAHGLLIVLAASFLPLAALETDQYYAWGRNLTDATRVLNAKVNLEISRALDETNRRESWRRLQCEDLVKQVSDRFRLFIFHDIEIWATQSPLVDRIPSTPEEELEYRRLFLYGRHGPFDTGTWVPPSPTIELDGVRLGTDKLSHFFSSGYWYYKWYRQGIHAGLSHEQAEQRAIRRGILLESTILGRLASGTFSPGDLEANYEGMRFLVQLCGGPSPMLEKTPDGWRQSRSFDFRGHVGPEWDESYEPAIYGKRRWAKVRPVLLSYCPLLHEPGVERQRQAYAARDRFTPTESVLAALVRKGKLLDPRQFSLETNCQMAAQPYGPSRAEAGPQGHAESRPE